VLGVVVLAIALGAGAAGTAGRRSVRGSATALIAYTEADYFERFAESGRLKAFTHFHHTSANLGV